MDAQGWVVVIAGIATLVQLTAVVMAVGLRPKHGQRLAVVATLGALTFMLGRRMLSVGAATGVVNSTGLSLPGEVLGLGTSALLLGATMLLKQGVFQLTYLPSADLALI